MNEEAGLVAPPRSHAGTHAKQVLILLSLFATSLTAPVHAQGVPSQRTPWTTSQVKGSPDPPLPYKATRVFPKVQLDRPTNITWLPAAKKWIANHAGDKIVAFENDPANAVAQPLFNLSDAFEHRVGTGYATKFHPDLKNQPWCFVTFTSPATSPKRHHLARLKVVDPTVPTFDLKSLKVLASWKGPGHVGSSMQFGPDGMLYVSIGDGQSPYPPDGDGTGQDNSDLRCTILRVDVDDPTEDQPYRIPPDNPFVGQPNVRGEIWAFGLRNPWKIAFNSETGDLVAADVGWEMRELIHRVEKGRNHGWSIMEGSQTVKQDEQPTIPITPPLFEHTHLESRSISGGHFWQSDRIPELKGAYIYGDWMNGKVWGLKFKGDEVVWQKELVDTPHRVICFMLDPNGEVLIVGYDGTILRLAPNTDIASEHPFPTKLSDTGLFADVKSQRPAAGVVEYKIRAPRWADGTHARQWIGLPDSSQLGLYKKSDWKTEDNAGRFIFPSDTVVAKTVSYRTEANAPDSQPRESVHLETQLLHKLGDEWRAYNYIWNEDQTDAELQGAEGTERKLVIRDPAAPGGKRAQVWRHASRSECLLCHTWSGGTVHGFWPPQLNIDAKNTTHQHLVASAPESHPSNQLKALQRLGLFAPSISEPELDPDLELAAPQDTSASLQSRARTYLELNCSMCHRRLGGGTADFNFDIANSLKENNYLDALPAQGTFGILDARVVAPGEPFRSVLMYRTLKSGRGHMPQLGSNVIDRGGTRLLHDWIAAMKEAPEHQTKLHDAQSISAAKEPSTRIKTMLTSVESAMALSMACSSDAFDEVTRAQVIKQGSQHDDPTIRDLFEEFLPEDQRVKRLGPTIDEPALLAMQGSVENGRSLFENAKDVNCRACHRIGTAGKEIGPDLSSIGLQRTPAELLDSILRPSEKIDMKYQARQVFTDDGKVLVGMVISETDTEVQLANVTGETKRIAVDDIEEMRTSQISVMPENLLSGMTQQNAADLLAYLAAQKKPLPPPQQKSE